MKVLSQTPAVHLRVDDTIDDLLEHPAFAGFARLLLPWDDRRVETTMKLNVRSEPSGLLRSSVDFAAIPFSYALFSACFSAGSSSGASALELPSYVPSGSSGTPHLLVNHGS